MEPAIGWLQEVLRWCDHWLKGRETGIMEEPLLRAWVQESVPPQTCYRERPGYWVGEDQWPSPRIEARRMALGDHGRLGAAGTGEVSICSPLWVGAAAGEVGRYGDDAEWATDQREDDGGSLVFVTEPLAEDVEILGAPQLHLTFASDKPWALVSVRVNDVAPGGASTRVAIGHLNLCHRFGHGAPQDLIPGEMTVATVDLDDIGHRFPAGHRIAVSISTVYWPIAWPSPELATLTLRLGESALVLPVRPARAEDAALRVFDAPECAEADAQHDLPIPPDAPIAQRRVTRDLLSGESLVEFPRWTYAMEMPAIGQTHRGTGYARYRITEGDPLSARCETGYTVRIERWDTTILHESEGSLTCDATHFIVSMCLRISENGVPVFSRDWNERIARDHM